MKNNSRGMEYKMTKKMFNHFLEGRSEEEAKQNPYNYVMDLVNREFGIKGTVKRILIYDN